MLTLHISAYNAVLLGFDSDILALVSEMFEDKGPDLHTKEHQVFGVVLTYVVRHGVLAPRLQEESLSGCRHLEQALTQQLQLPHLQRAWATAAQTVSNLQTVPNYKCAACTRLSQSDLSR